MVAEVTAERCKPSDVFKVSPDLAGDIVLALENYMKPFARPIWKHGAPPKEPTMMFGSEQICLNCSKHLEGFLGTFAWGIAHGEGVCQHCKWPARAYHAVRDDDGLIITFHMVLQYHPDEVQTGGAD